MTNQGNVNENRTKDDMAWAAMGQEEVQYQLNDADKYDITSRDIILNRWKYINGKLMVKVTGLHGLGYDTVDARDVNIDYPDTLAL